MRRKKCLIKIYVEYKTLNQILKNCKIPVTTYNRQQLLNTIKTQCYYGTDSGEIEKLVKEDLDRDYHDFELESD